MTQSEYARHRGKSRQYISKLAQSGTLIMRGGKVDVRGSDAVLNDRPVVVEPNQAMPVVLSRPAADSLGQAGASFGQARTVDMIFRAKLRRLEFEARQAELVDAEMVRKAAADALGLLREGFLGVADRLAMIIAGETDAKRVHVILKTDLTRELHRLADAILAV